MENGFECALFGGIQATVLSSSQQSHLALSAGYAQGISLDFSLDVEMPELAITDGW